MELQKDLKEFVALLNATNVKYLVVGGYAVAFHGYPRYTGDIDVFVEVTADNAGKLAEVLREFGFAGDATVAEFLSDPRRIIRMGNSPYRIEVLGTVDGVSFEEAWAARIETVVDGISIYIISKPLLLKNKKAAGRPKDLIDVDHLARLD